MIQNQWDAAKTVLREKFVAIHSHLRKQDKSQTNNLTLHLKQLEREQTKPKVRRKEIIKIRAEIKNMETKKIIKKSNETKIWFSGKINKTKLINL